MKNQMIKVGTAVPEMKVANVAYNVASVISAMKKHKDCGILVFPELCITGYTCADLFQQNVLLEAAESGLMRIAEETRKLPGLTVFVGIPIHYENSLYNCAAAVSEGVIAGIVPKEFIPTYGEFYEGRWFTSGKNIIGRMIQYAGQEIPFGIDLLFEDSDSNVLIGTDICEDLWVPDKPSTHACLAGANIIVNLSASDEIIGKQDYRRQLVSSQSASCYCGYLYVSSGTDESSTDLVFSGHSMIAENGRILNDSIFGGRPDIRTALIDLAKIKHDRIHESTFTAEDSSWFRHAEVSAKPVSGKKEINADQLAAALKKEAYPIDPNPFVPADDAE
ncbi:MAG: NAD(+) synthase, partial [Erysipelotrichia bacterium]|nr:NAD(+) synthase [Erysipelotrichia bacterium]